MILYTDCIQQNPALATFSKMKHDILRFFVYILGAVMIVASVAVPGALAATSTITGKVTDSQTGDALPGANVLLKGTSLGASTDLNGNFTIVNVPPKSYVLRVTYVGYEPAEVKVDLKPGETVTKDIRLQAVGVKGKAVVVTAQASGQSGAINQQLSSDRIENVVSAARIQELPDANAAESVGRLPGVSLIRQGGQATEVVIRGLAPQYNEITVDGVQMPGNVSTSNPTDLTSAYNSGDRAVNLSMISSNMLGGIEVTKSITPDMDAAVLGGVVNFNLREAQTRALHFHLTAQGGYDNLKNTYNDYKFVGTVEKRFFDDKFGVFAEADVERQNLSANVLGANYNILTKNFGVRNKTYLFGVTLTDVPRTQKRYDGTVTMDYRLNQGKIDFMAFYSHGASSEQDRAETFNLVNGGNDHVYSLTNQATNLTEATSILDYEQQIGNWNVNAKVANAFAQNNQPYINNWQFQQGSPTGFGSLADQSLPPWKIPSLANDSLLITPMFQLSSAHSIKRQDNLTGWLNLKTNVNFSDLITSTIKFGGEFMYTNRSYNFTYGNGNVFYSGQNVINGIAQAFPYMRSTLNKYGPIMPLFIDSTYSYGKFLGGDYKMGSPLDLGILNQVLGIAKKYGTLESWSPNAEQSGEHNYVGDEYRSAGYGMITVHFGPDITFLPGVRYQVLETRYTAPRALSQLGPISVYHYAHRDTTVDLAHGFWLPMVHLMYRPFSWLQVHLAYTNTLTYPSYSDITPELQVLSPNSVDYHNYLLKPGESANYDAVVSVYNNTIGLFSVDGFYKRIKNLIFATGQSYIINTADYPGVPKYAAGYSIQTAENDPYPADVYGVELDWQTHFWYLPGPLSGLILNVNFTHVISKARYPYTYLNVQTLNHPPYQIADTVVTYYSDRMLDQPNDIANVIIGYDLGGFGARLSMVYQSNIFGATNFWPELRSNTAKYLSWDASVKQNLPLPGLQVYMDFVNINNAAETQINQGSSFPSSENLYGLTIDLGLRWQI